MKRLNRGGERSTMVDRAEAIEGADPDGIYDPDTNKIDEVWGVLLIPKMGFSWLDASHDYDDSHRERTGDMTLDPPGTPMTVMGYPIVARDEEGTLIQVRTRSR